MTSDELTRLAKQAMGEAAALAPAAMVVVIMVDGDGEDQQVGVSARDVPYDSEATPRRLAEVCRFVADAVMAGSAPRSNPQ